jgi:hypothetical protein
MTHSREQGVFHKPSYRMIVLRRMLRMSVIAGAIAATPTVLAIIGWASHWNAYVNLTLTLVSLVYWIVIWKVVSDV